jgi:hypothetical protein
LNQFLLLINLLLELLALLGHAGGFLLHLLDFLLLIAVIMSELGYIALQVSYLV